MPVVHPIGPGCFVERGGAAEVSREDYPPYPEAAIESFSGSKHLRMKAFQPEPAVVLRVEGASVHPYGVLLKEGFFLDANNSRDNTEIALDRSPGFALEGDRRSGYRLREAAGSVRAARACYLHCHPNFAAWMMGEMPRLGGYASFLAQGYKLALHGDLLAFHEESLRLCGITEEMILRVPKGAAVESDELIFSVPTYRHHIPSPACAAFWRSFLHTFRSDSFSPGPKVYLSRARQKSRRIVNEEKVIRCLERAGFRAVEPESLSVSAQISLFHQAELIVTPFGGALTNLLFGPVQAGVICVLKTKFTNEFARLARLCGRRLVVFDDIRRLTGIFHLFSKDKEVHQRFTVHTGNLEVFLEKLEAQVS